MGWEPVAQLLHKAICALDGWGRRDGRGGGGGIQSGSHLRKVQVAQEPLEGGFAISSFIKEGHGLQRKTRLRVTGRKRAHVAL